MKESVIDLTVYHGLCGDPLVYILDEMDHLGRPCRITVIYEKYDELEEISGILENMGFSVLMLERKDDKAVLIIEAV